MTNTTPEDWVLIEAAKRAGYHWLNHTVKDLRDYYVEGDHDDLYPALCDMIAKHEQPPVDRKLLCAKEAMRFGRNYANQAQLCVRAIELWESGYGQ